MTTQQHTENLNTRFLSGVSRENTHRDETPKVPHSTEVNNFWKLLSLDNNMNETQYFSNVSEVARNFLIGGYQPAQKWIKDRKDRELSYDDILHYQKIIVELSEMDRIMKEIDEVRFEPNGI